MAVHQLYVGGRWTGSASGRTFESLDPYAGEPWATVPDAGVEDVDAAVRAAHEALSGPWGATTGFERAAGMRRLAAILERDADELARVESVDNGKLLREMSAQMHYIPAWLHYFAGLADKLQGETIPSDKPNYLIYTRHEPVGVVAAVVPWNSPLLLTIWKLAPALAAGCTFVLKPSDHTPVSALELARRVEEAELPAGVFNVVTAKAPSVSQALVEHPLVDKIAFTGSTRVGKAVARSAADRLARVTLELGGKSAQLVFEDADVEAARNGVVSGIFAASGQTCIAGSRLLVHRSVEEELVSGLVDRARTIRLGNPLEADTEMGPVANRSQYDTVLGFVERAQAEGAELACGGAAEQGGLFVAPTILTRVTPEMEVAREEVFGPVLAVMPFDDEDEAVAMANATEYGLAAGVWTENVHRAHRVAHRLRAGTVWINSYRAVAPSAPFGGVGSSGWGRENGLDAIREYTETKTIWVELTGQTRDPFTLG
ncbi:MAG: (Z)-2-((N-methylformamido)methylene)-5-hydroxybutyrolactone dehydrogenase [Thermoleophilaceae bacterium]|jgi:aldehyde dehydrogenase (NAD+)|nr:(Z)-2-((N-methylformamido)methylene)-5-hydroxybutyrolactone dehydrogenase [Thermoleophilaceae bacterium]